MFAGGDSVKEAVFVVINTETRDLKALDVEARSVLNSVKTVAARFDDSLVVIQQTHTDASRGVLSLVDGSFVGFRLRPSGEWEQLRPVRK